MAVPGSSLEDEESIRWQLDFQELRTLLPCSCVTWPGTKVPWSSLSGEGYRESSTCVRFGIVAMEQVQIAAWSQKEDANQEIDDEERRQAADEPCTNRRVPDDGRTKRACC